MNQQEAQNLFNEKISAFQTETLFENTAIATIHHPYLNALRTLSVMQLKVSIEDYKASLETQEFYSLKIAGLILHVVEKATPEQLGMALEDYAALQIITADAAEEYKAIFEPKVKELKAEIEPLIEVPQQEAPKQPKIKELYKKNNTAPKAEA